MLRERSFLFNDSVEICPLADKELIDSCYNLLDRNMMLETDGIYGQIAVIDATTSDVLAWASLEKQLDGDCGWCGDMVYVPFKSKSVPQIFLYPYSSKMFRGVKYAFRENGRYRMRNI